MSNSRAPRGYRRPAPINDGKPFFTPRTYLYVGLPAVPVATWGLGLTVAHGLIFAGPYILAVMLKIFLENRSSFHRNEP